MKRKRRKRGRKSAINGATGVSMLVLLILGGHGTVMAQEVNSRVQPCPGQSFDGYFTIPAMNLDMQEELQRIEDGKDPEPVYNFIFCPNQQISAQAGPLRPILNGANITCGISGTVNGNCVVVKGGTQVSIQDPNTTDVNFLFEQISIYGLSFEDWVGTSTVAAAASGFTALFVDCRWRNFATSHGIVIRHPLQTAMRVDIEGGEVDNAIVDVWLDNDEGYAFIRNLVVRGVEALTFAATGNSAVTYLLGGKVTNCDMDSFAITLGASYTRVHDFVLEENVGFMEVFFTEGWRSETEISNVKVSKNDSPDDWSAVFINDLGAVTIFNTEFSNNTHLRTGVDAGDNSFVYMEDVYFIGNEGSLDVGAPVFILSDTELEMVDVVFQENTFYSTTIFVIWRSTATVSRSCISGGVDYFSPIFVGNDATMLRFDNNVESQVSPECRSRGVRLFKEDPTAACYQGGNCTGSCQLFGESDVCLQAVNPTPAPNAPPTVIPPSIVPPSFSTPPTVPDPAETEQPTTTPPTTPQPTTPSTAQPTPAPTSEPTTAAPTNVPSTIPTTSFAPTVSVAPTSSPSTSHAPTRSLAPSSAPTTSQAPTTSLVPSVNPSAAPVPPTQAPTPATQPTRPPSDNVLPGTPTSRPTPPPVPLPPTVKRAKKKNIFRRGKGHFGKKGGKKGKDKGKGGKKGLGKKEKGDKYHNAKGKKQGKVKKLKQTTAKREYNTSPRTKQQKITDVIWHPKEKKIMSAKETWPGRKKNKRGKAKKNRGPQQPQEKKYTNRYYRPSAYNKYSPSSFNKYGSSNQNRYHSYRQYNWRQ